MRRLRADLSPTDSARRYRDLGVDVFLGEARFTGRAGGLKNHDPAERTRFFSGGGGGDAGRVVRPVCL